MGIKVFIPAPFPRNESARNAAVERCGILNRFDDQEFSKICRLVRRQIEVDWVGIAVIYKDDQRVIASSSGRLGYYRRSTSFCSYVVAYPESQFIVLDARSDERYQGSPFVDDGIISFFAGSAITDKDNYIVGAICATSSTPKNSFDSEHASILEYYAQVVHDILIRYDLTI